MLKLYEVNIEDVMYCWAESEEDAIAEAENHTIGLDLEYRANEARSFCSQWGDSVPYGGKREDCRTVREIFAEARRVADERKKKATDEAKHATLFPEVDKHHEDGVKDIT